jgi:hypothetical protein
MFFPILFSLSSLFFLSNLTFSAPHVSKYADKMSSAQVNAFLDLIEIHINLIHEELKLRREQRHLFRKGATKQTLSVMRHRIKMMQDVRLKLRKSTRQLEMFEVDSPLSLKVWIDHLKSKGFVKEAHILCTLILKFKVTQSILDEILQEPINEAISRLQAVEKLQKSYAQLDHNWKQ